jgi:hypothetical protein|tara:strand:+ start:307 stop:570 length:264 start_codon:yes stop_codon:yes gene_type:complete
MSQSQVKQELSDREKCIHCVVTLIGYFRSENIENEKLFSYLLETTRIALFVSISEKQMWKILDQCMCQDKSMLKLSQNMQEYLENSR